jgi:ribonuclease P protein subunit POP4
MHTIPLVKDELIGKTVTIIDCTDPTWNNTIGVIIDETQYTFVIETNEHRRQIAKDTATFVFNEGGEQQRVHGSQLLFRPENRIKKAR